jgi:glycosyltransferase involved in cell wall biosynthesis
MRVAIISTFPPEVCGIGQYAEAQAQVLEGEGHEVRRIAVASLRAGWGPLGKGKPDWVDEALEADRIYVHYHVSFYDDAGRRFRHQRFLGPHRRLLALARRAGPKLQVIVHEPSFRRYRPDWFRFQYRIVRAFFRAAGELVFHTEAERSEFARRFRFQPRSRILAPGHFYRTRVSLGQAEARRRLGVPEDRRVYLCIGHFHAQKGFTEFARAFAASARPPAHLYVVTSVRQAGETANRRGLDELVAWARGQPLVTVLDAYVTDEEFDSWIVAADFVVVPYRTGFSSSIGARAAVYGKTCIYSSDPTLKDQARPGDLVFRDDADLARLLAALAGPPVVAGVP